MNIVNSRMNDVYLCIHLFTFTHFDLLIYPSIIKFINVSFIHGISISIIMVVIYSAILWQKVASDINHLNLSH